MGEGRLQFDDSIPTVSGILRRAGYATLALSANGLLGPLFSFSESFESYRCAEWWEKSFRWIPPESLSGLPQGRPRGLRATGSILLRGFPPRRARQPPAPYLRGQMVTRSLREVIRELRPEELPVGHWTDSVSWAAIDGANRLARWLRAPEDPGPLPVTPWIESTFEAWLRDQPPERPVHCFINLLDVHEKYLSDAERVAGLWAWLRYCRIPQNARLWLSGEWRPDRWELDLLQRLYEAVLAKLDRRVGSLIEILRRSGRWENTLLVVTSDHGQAFGEHGALFHARSPYEPLLHVPLWVRWPHGEGGGDVRRERVSLVDVAPTLLRAAHISVPVALSGISLQRDPSASRKTPVCAMADGYPTIETYRDGLAKEILDRLRRTFTVTYSGSFKVVAESPRGSVQTFNLEEDPNEEVDLGSVPSGERAELERYCRQLSDRISQTRGGVPDPALQERLRTWGYL